MVTKHDDDDFYRDFDRHFNSMEHTVDKAFAHPFRFLAKWGTLVLVLSLLFFGALIAMVVVGLSILL